MPKVLLNLQIFITILISLIIVLQKSGSDGILPNSNNQVSGVSRVTFINKVTIALIFIFMTNSLFLARSSLNKSTDNKSIVRSLEGKEMLQDKIINDTDVPKME